MAKRRRGRAFWARLISDFESNGGRERHAAFAVRHGVLLLTFRTWLYRLRSERSRRQKAVVFCL
jgi:hypothetical protein